MSCSYWVPTFLCSSHQPIMHPWWLRKNYWAANCRHLHHKGIMICHVTIIDEQLAGFFSWVKPHRINPYKDQNNLSVVYDNWSDVHLSKIWNVVGNGIIHTNSWDFGKFKLVSCGQRMWWLSSMIHVFRVACIIGPSKMLPSLFTIKRQCIVMSAVKRSPSLVGYHHSLCGALFSLLISNCNLNFCNIVNNMLAHYETIKRNWQCSFTFYVAIGWSGECYATNWSQWKWWREGFYYCH